jgi:type I restriction enzyme S subunit
MQYGLNESDIQKMNGIFAAYKDVEQAVLYGSRAKGNFKPYSDIDIALKGNNLDLSLKWKMEDNLDDLLLPYKMDIVIFSQILNPDLVEHINRVGKIFYSKGSADLFSNNGD